MADTIVERDSSSGVGTGMVMGIVAVLLVVVVMGFFVFGGFGRMTGGNPGQTNVNVPSQGAPQGGPNINVPRSIDVNVNQPAAPSGNGQ
jgi:hypothetical protein